MSKKYDIAVMPGDFIGKEVIAEALSVLKVISEIFGFEININIFPHGGEHYFKTKELFPETVLHDLKEHDAILFGAVGHPNVDPKLIERGILLKMRFDLDLYVNLRPSCYYAGVNAPIKILNPDLPDGYTITVVREGTSGLYKGKGSYENGVACQIMEYSDTEVERILRYAFQLAQTKEQKLILGFKSNVLQYISEAQWQPMFERMNQEEFPEVETEYKHIDALNGPLLIDSLPKESFIIVTGNMFGDIITDLTTSLFGGMGIGPSACINPNGVSMFEPLHGSSPKDYGLGKVSPVAAILSAAMMLRHLGEIQAADQIEISIANVLKRGKIPNFTIHSGVSTREQTQYIIDELTKKF